MRPACVELSSVGLGFRGHQASSADVFRALEPVHRLLEELGDKNALDGKLAEYAFFPLSHLFNEAKRLSARCLETTIECLRILVAKGWGQTLSPQLGKQLIILLTLIVGRAPGQGAGGQHVVQQPEELVIAGFGCFTTIFRVLDGPVAKRIIYNEVGEATVLDQTIYILLEGISDARSDNIGVAAAEALEALFFRVTDRVVLASVTPRTVSTLTKVLKPTTQTRRSYQLVVVCLHILTYILRTLLNGHVTLPAKDEATQVQRQPSDKLVLDNSWLKATTTQVKLALANVIQIRRHPRPEVQDALLELCVMVIEDCQMSLEASIPMIVETVVVLSNVDENQVPNRAFSTLRTLVITHPVVVDCLKESLQGWIVSFPRTMQSNDETAKQWGIRQISTAFQILSELSTESEILTSNLASGLCDSIAIAVGLHTSPPVLPYRESVNLDILKRDTDLISFPPVLLEQRSQRQTLKDLQSMISRLNQSSSGAEIARSIVNRVHGATGETILPPFWLSLTFLHNTSQFANSFDDFISVDAFSSSFSTSTRAGMIEELYYVSLPLLNRSAAEISSDWRVSALSLEAVALQAQQLGEAFRPELMDALYPTLQLLASGHSDLQKHAMICLNILTTACNYPNTGVMVIENADYLVNSVALKLNTFDVSPYPSQVLLMMVKLCGASLIPYLDDLIDSIFGILDMYHGYPTLVEIMFKALAAVVEEGVKAPSMLAITASNETGWNDRRKRYHPTISMSSLSEELASQKAKRVKRLREEIEDDVEYVPSHHDPPLSGSEKNPDDREEADSLEDALEKENSDESLPPPREPSDAEKPLSKSHTLLLHIVKSTIPHLSSPSPYLRRSLLAILGEVLPVLALNENSFLPLINELWPSISSKVAFPSSFLDSSSADKSSLSTIGRPEKEGTVLDHRDETFVVVAACHVLEEMCKGAGDFMASRVESVFPKWQRLYLRAWDKVSDDAERAIERRYQQLRRNNIPTTIHPEKNNDNKPTTSSEKSPNNIVPYRPGFAQSSLSLTTKTAETSPFTPHHKLWRALVSLFITILSHVRLPLTMGDQICEFLGAWIARFVGPDYYFLDYHHGARSSSSSHARIPDSVRDELGSVDDAIQTMETWNADLTWFIFQQERVRVNGIMVGKDASGVGGGGGRSEFMASGRNKMGVRSFHSILFGDKVKFAEPVF